MHNQHNSRILLLVAAHFRQTTEVSSFIEHICQLPVPDGWKVELAIADNSLSWHSEQTLPNNVHIYTPERNLGYLNGCSFAFVRWCEENCRRPDWVGVANTDIELAEDFFTTLLTSQLPPEAAVVAPETTLPDGTPQNPYLRRRPSRAKVYSYILMHQSVTLTILSQILKARKDKRRKMLSESRPAQELQPIYAPHGSAMFINKTFFDRGGSLAFDGFMYSEEIHIAEQCRRAGLEIVWHPGLRVRHNEHATLSRISRIRRMRWRHESIKVIWLEYFRKTNKASTSINRDWGYETQ